MTKKRKLFGKEKRASPGGGVGFLLSTAAYETLCVQGYTSLSHNPEIITGCRKIAELISSMTIHLMEDKGEGARRLKNTLSRKVDIEPYRYMTRKSWMDAIIMNLLLYGNGNSVVLPLTNGGLLGDLIPIPASNVSFVPDGYGYKVMIQGREYLPEDVLHFVHNPDPSYPWRGQGITAAIKDVANNLKQAAATEKGFMESKWKPSIIVKVDGMTEEFSSPEGREKLMDSYIASNSAGEPWLIPAEQFEVEQVKPLSIADLALKDTVELDKRTVAAILGVPPFVLGIGEYKADEWNAFISNTIRPIAKGIEQELTKKLLTSPEWYWRFNVASLYSYDLKTVADVYSGLYVKGIVDGNEVRDKVSMSPRNGLDDLVILENYIPLDKVGDQLKLKQEGGEKDA